MIDIGEPPDALDLAQAGLYAIRRDDAPEAAALLRIIEARAHARMGSAEDCRRSLERAEDAFGRAGEGAGPAWAEFFDETALSGLIGAALRDLALADPEHGREHAASAEPWTARAARDRRREYLRSKILDTDGLAVTRLLLGEPEAAAELAISALSIAREVTSARVTSRLGRTARLAAERFPDARGVAELAALIRETPRPGAVIWDG